MNYIMVIIGGGVGSFLIGFLINLFDLFSLEQKWKLLIITGFLGGYTTYSAYSYETIKYFQNGNIKLALLNILIHNVLCLLLVLFGLWLNKIIFAK